MAQERKGKKLRRCTAKSKAYYALQRGKSEDNLKRFLRRHLRHHPHDQVAVRRYEQTFGSAEHLGLNAAGRRLQRHQTERDRYVRSRHPRAKHAQDPPAGQGIPDSGQAQG